MLKNVDHVFKIFGFIVYFHYITIDYIYTYYRTHNHLHNLIRFYGIYTYTYLYFYLYVHYIYNVI